MHPLAGDTITRLLTEPGFESSASVTGVPTDAVWQGCGADLTTDELIYYMEERAHESAISVLPVEQALVTIMGCAGRSSRRSTTSLAHVPEALWDRS